MKTTQSLVLSPTYDSDEEELEEEEEEKEEEEDLALEMLQDEPELPAADVVSAAKQFLSMLMTSLEREAKTANRIRTRTHTRTRTRARKVPAMACRAHNLLAYALLRNFCQEHSASIQHARKEEAGAEGKDEGKGTGNDDSKEKSKSGKAKKVKRKDPGKGRGAGNQDKEKTESKVQDRSKKTISREDTTPASLFRLLLTDEDADKNTLLAKVLTALCAGL